MTRWVGFGLAWVLAMGVGRAQAGADSSPRSAEVELWRSEIEMLESSSGRIVTAGGKVEIDLPQGWRFFGPKPARFVVESLWRNPPDPSVIGLIAPPEFLEAAKWAIVVTFDDGHVTTGESRLSPAVLMDELKRQTDELNRERGPGHGAVALTGWARRPEFDEALRCLRWGRFLTVDRGGRMRSTLNYDVRLLGRRGALALSAVADAEDLAAVERACDAVVRRARFVVGEAYGDFRPDRDPVREGGVAALVTGGAFGNGATYEATASWGLPLGIGLLLACAVVAAGCWRANRRQA